MNGAPAEQRSGDLFIFPVLAHPGGELGRRNVARFERLFPRAQVFRSPLGQGAFYRTIGPYPAGTSPCQRGQETDPDRDEPEAGFIV